MTTLGNEGNEINGENECLAMIHLIRKFKIILIQTKQVKLMQNKYMSKIDNDQINKFSFLFFFLKWPSNLSRQNLIENISFFFFFPIFSS